MAETPSDQPPSVDKAAPRPEDKGPLLRRAFWCLVIAAFLGPVFLVLVAYHQREDVPHIQAANDARALADALFDMKRFDGAAGEYSKIIRDYSDVPELAAYATVHIHMARAEQALQGRQWGTAYEESRMAEDKGAPSVWLADFKDRFGREHERAEADARLAGGDLAGAEAIYNRLAAVTPTQAPAPGPPEKFKDPKEKLAWYEFQDLLLKGKAAYRHDRLGDASNALTKAKQQAEDLNDAAMAKEAADLLEAVEERQRVVEEWAAAEKALAEGAYMEAAKHYKTCDELSPSEVYKAKFHKAMALAALEYARVLRDGGRPSEAAEFYRRVLQHDPENAEAKQFLDAMASEDDGL